MKKTIIHISLVTALWVTGCTKKFDAINTDPTKASAATFDPNLLLPSAELGYIGAVSGYSGPILFQSMWIQTFASAIYPGYYSNGDKYVQGGSYLSYQASTWNNAYRAASFVREIQNLTKGNAALSNLSGIALITELLNIEAVTDVYGDAPYLQGLQAKTGISQPVYDKQQDIYNSMLSKLDSVIVTLDAAKAIPTNDVFPYKGNIAKWKKFGYSLMLRMAMRLTKADAATAKKYAEKAFAGGVFAGNEDNAYVIFDFAHGFQNANSAALTVAEDYSEVRWGKVLIDYLKSTADPRLGVIAEVPKPGKANAANKSLAGDATPINQQGMPNGYDQNGGTTDISNSPGYPGATGTGLDANPTGGYSRPTTAVYLPLNTPSFILTYAQTEFLLAEAAVRGWNVGPSASVHYSNALAAALQTYSTLNAAGAVSATVATAYAAANPLDISSTDNSLKQINTQYWVLEGTILDFDEAWSNWRRSGYPVLTPVVYPGNFTNGTIPRRQSYPTSEASTNPANYKTAVSALNGGDTYAGRVWWDK
ncbi:MAG: SusD/RagB family nutrient-binding outer membrane lipoprotein [Chitinophagaceae bacterium]